ncbi:advillin-like [Penaeus indicus]|uniref:advillin-like n=1 Tax=Penaeus indicus TaxID=29960 RepID=UPI00300D80A7
MPRESRSESAKVDPRRMLAVYPERKVSFPFFQYYDASMGEIPKDPAFNIIPKNSTCFIIWRVENLQLVALKREDYGKFHKGDSYIIFSASEYGKPAGMDDTPHPPKGALDIHIHFWLGSETSTDEAGVAAIKTVELDNLLGGGPVQHRETEGNESKRFLSYFKNGIRLLKGGITSGLRHVTDDFEPAIYHVKGKRSTVVTELSAIDWKLMNDGDVYVIDNREIIYVWTGRNSNNMEKIQGAKFAGTLRQEHGGGSVVVVEDGQEAALVGEERGLFDKMLPLNNKQVVPASQAPKDETVARRMCGELKLFKCSDESGVLKVTEVKNGPLSQADLDSKDSFIVDNGQDGIWVWVGKKATQKERDEALRNAQGFVTKKGYPPSTKVSRVIDNGEPPEFKTLFKDWKDKDQSKGFGRQASTSKIAHTVQTKFDASTLHSTPELSAKTQMVDDGSGQKEVWRIKDFDLIPVPESQYGEFFMGDCYIVLYAYLEGNNEHYLLYYWIGSDASQDEAGTAALKAVELDDKLQGRAIQIRVVQGKEPPHFMAIFGGKMVIFEGGFASSFDGSGARDEGRKSSYMLQIRGTTSHNTKAIEVDLRAGCLNSNDCFVVATPQTTYVWCGKGSTGDEREMAKTFASSRGDTLIVSEGYEKEEFWRALGGKEPYATTPKLKEEHPAHPPRLFQCSNATGVFKGSKGNERPAEARDPQGTGATGDSEEGVTGSLSEAQALPCRPLARSACGTQTQQFHRVVTEANGSLAREENNCRDLISQKTETNDSPDLGSSSVISGWRGLEREVCWENNTRREDIPVFKTARVKYTSTFEKYIMRRFGGNPSNPEPKFSYSIHRSSPPRAEPVMDWRNNLVTVELLAAGQWFLQRNCQFTAEAEYVWRKFSPAEQAAEIAVLPNLPSQPQAEQRASDALALEYLRTDPAGREGVPIIKLKQGYEPPNFTGHFGVWDNDLWNDNMTYADICERLQEVSPGATVLVTSSGSGTTGRRTYPLATLREKDPEKLPPEVDPVHKEDFLSDADFMSVFGVGRDGIDSIPMWKRNNMKKKAGLF